MPDHFILADEVELVGESELLEAYPLPKDEPINADPLGSDSGGDLFADEDFDFGAPVGPSAPLASDSVDQDPGRLSLDPPLSESHLSELVAKQPGQTEPLGMDLLETSPVDDEAKQPRSPNQRSAGHP